jgi:ABC-type multidrug transport system ATPase subunit
MIFDIVCGSLAQKERPLRPPGHSCGCDEGWAGINCNVCTQNSVCDSLIPTGQNGTCYNHFGPVNRNHIMCDVTNQAIVKLLAEQGRKPKLSLGCDKDRHCHFEFWAGDDESFFCEMDECHFKEEFQPTMNLTTAICPKMRCRCYPDRLLCQKNGLSFSDWFDDPEEGPNGPGTFVCEERYDGLHIERHCTFSEPHMNEVISQFFGDPSIQLSCPQSGECLHYSQVPGYKRPEFKQGFPLEVLIILGASAFIIVSLIIAGLVHLKKRAEMGQDGYIPVASDDQDEFQRRQDMMSHHTPCTITFRNVLYTIETKKKIWSAATNTSPEPTENEDDAINMAQPHQTPDLLPKQKQVVLEGIQGSVGPGQVLAIMGGSGAGKSTLLDILARKNKSGVVSGDILVNGQFMDYKKYRSIIGYVDQEDTLMDTLTVYETIMYSALLRLPRKMPLSAKKRRVQETMMELGIIGIANRRVGSSGNRGISGGEKRRVSIACELVTSPSILFLDEPTSGLDSYNAYNVIECLIGLARDYRRTVIFTIHQPRSNIYALFDQLILLAKGRLIYSGPAQQAVIEHFSELGYECPMGFNIADYFVDLTMHAAVSSADRFRRDDDDGGEGGIHDSIDLARTESGNRRSNIRLEQESQLYSPRSFHSSPHRTVNSPARDRLGDPDWIRPDQGNPVYISGEPNPVVIVDNHLIKPYLSDDLMSLIQGFDASQMSKALHVDINTQLQTNYGNSIAQELNGIRFRSIQRRALDLSQVDLNSITNTVTHLTSFLESQFHPISTRSGANIWGQFKILSGRTLKNLYRNPDLLQTHYVISIVAAVVCGFLFWKVDNTLSGFQNRLGVMFFICALFGFSCLSSMQVFASERAIFVRERANRYYTPFTYFLSKVFLN